MGTQGQRHSTLKAINPDTVKKLAPVWAFSFGGEKQRGQESQPIVHDGTIYVTGPIPGSSRSMPAPATRSGSTTPAFPKASCRAATW